MSRSRDRRPRLNCVLRLNVFSAPYFVVVVVVVIFGFCTRIRVQYCDRTHNIIDYGGFFFFFYSIPNFFFIRRPNRQTTARNRRHMSPAKYKNPHECARGSYIHTRRRRRYTRQTAARPIIPVVCIVPVIIAAAHGGRTFRRVLFSPVKASQNIINSFFFSLLYPAV